METNRLHRAARAAALLAAALVVSACGSLGSLVPRSSTPAPVLDANAPKTAPPVAAANAPAAAPPAATVAAPKPAAPPRKAADAADAVPRVDRIPAGPPNRPYAIRGETYEPEAGDVPMLEVGIASWYGRPFHGRPAATGERYDMDKMTAAHPTMPLPSYARVRNLENGREVVVRVNDRGPFYGGRIIDLSRAAARKLGIGGTALVEVERLTHDDIRTGAWRERSATALAARKAPPLQTARQGTKAGPAATTSLDE
jgi:rare lipoprotein A